jgi:hypothetical protein
MTIYLRKIIIYLRKITNYLRKMGNYLRKIHPYRKKRAIDLLRIGLLEQAARLPKRAAVLTG